MVDIVAQPRRDLCQLERKEIAGIHRDHLAKLHCRPAQMRQAIGEPADIAGGKQQVAHSWPLARCQSPGSLGKHAPADPGGESSELAEARYAPAGNCALAWLGGIVAHQPVLPGTPLNGPARSGVIQPP